MAGRIAYYGNTVTNGLVLSLDAAKRDSYPGSGTIWRDISGNGNNGTLTNGPTFNSDNGGAIVFDGVDDYVDTLTLSSGSAISSYTFSVWLNPSTTAFNALQRGNDGAGNGWSLLAGVDTQYRVGIVTTIPSTVGYVTTSSFAATLNSWANVTGVWNAGSSLSLYVNGNLANSISIPGTTLRSSTLGWVLGRITTSLYSAGKISNTQVYNRVLSSSEILQNYNAQKSRYGL
jgi:hypothetical protein